MPVIRRTSQRESSPAVDDRGRLLPPRRAGVIWFWVLVGALLALPVVLATARAVDAGWVPESDDAIVALHTYDVFTTHPPLVGMPSTLGSYANSDAASHPGPAEFDVLAGPYRLFGGAPWSLVVTAATIALISLALALVALARRAGGVVAAGAAIVLAALLWGLGDEVREILNPSIALLPLATYLVLVAVIVDGGIGWLPVLVAFGSFVLQCHLSYVGLVGLPGLVALAAFLVHCRRGNHRHPLRIGLIGVAVGVAFWLQPLIQQFTGGSGNLTAIVGGFASPGLPKAGLGFSVNVVARIVGVPIAGLRPHELAVWPVAGAGAIDWCVFLLPWACLAALAVLALRRHEPVALRAVGSGAAVLLAGVITALVMPRNAWIVDGHSVMVLFPVAAVVWITIGWAFVVLVRGHVVLALRGNRRLLFGGLCVAVLITMVCLPRAAPRALLQGRVRIASDLVAAARRVPQAPAYRVVTKGGTAFISTGSAVLVALQRRGQPVCIVPAIPLSTFPFGEQRRCSHLSRPLTVVVQSGEGKPPAGSRLLGTARPLDDSSRARLRRLRSEVLASIDRGGLHLTPRGEALLRSGHLAYHGPLVGDLLGDLRQATSEPRRSVQRGTLAALASQGLVRVDGVSLEHLVAEAELTTLAGPEGQVQLFVLDDA